MNDTTIPRRGDVFYSLCKDPKRTILKYDGRGVHPRWGWMREPRVITSVENRNGTNFIHSIGLITRRKSGKPIAQSRLTNSRGWGHWAPCYLVYRGEQLISQGR